jgi:hypothetical protein
VLTLVLAVTGSVRSAAAVESEPSPSAARPAGERAASAPAASARPASEHPSRAELPPEIPTSPVRHSHAGLLTASYVLAPLLALAVGGGISKLTKRDEISVTGGCLMFLLPASVHVAHGKAGQGLVSFAQMVGFTLVGGVVGGIIGGVYSSETCTSDSSDGCEFAGLAGLMGGSLIGGVAGYTGFAIYDVWANATYLTDEPGAPEADAASLPLWVQPVPARAEQANAVGPWSGLQLGLSLAM